MKSLVEFIEHINPMEREMFDMLLKIILRTPTQFKLKISSQALYFFTHSRAF
jgi:hypothetical protein